MATIEPTAPISVDETRERLVALCAARQLPSDKVALAHALDRVLATDVVAGISIPPFANSAMDGFALRGRDLPTKGHRDFILIGTRLAGAPEDFVVGEGECLRITTGAALPAGADTVVIKENTSVDGDRVRVHAGEKPGSNVRPQGEDIACGSTVLKAGQRVDPACLGVLASLGIDAVDVVRAPRVVLITTGDELVPPGQPLGPAQIHNSNGYAIGAQLLRMGVELVLPKPVGGALHYGDDTGPLHFLQVRDDADALRVNLLAASAVADLVITSGGVSAGEADLLPGIVAELGKIHFWKVRMRPGMPLLCGEIAGTLLVGLPGNPVSSLASLTVLLQPGLAAMQCMSATLRSPSRHVLLATALNKSHGRTEFVRARLEERADGRGWAIPITRQGSGMLSGMIHADGLLVVDESLRDVPAGTALPWIPIR